jgi:hypothetical protein
MFDKNTFERSFNASLEKIQGSEAITRKELRDISRTVLEAWHATGNVVYANRLLKALTPVNKKTAIVFFKHFSGFHFDDVMGEFDHKSKKRYDKAHADCVKFLTDPNNNIWSWAERHIEIEQKVFSIDSVEKYMTKAIKQAAGVGLSQVDLLKAVFKAGIDPQCIVEVMDQMGYEFSEDTPEHLKTVEVAPY